MANGFISRFKGKILVPAGSLFQFGKSGGDFGASGNLNTSISGAGVSPGATGADNVLAVFTLPANAFDVASRGINISAAGSFANNAHTKDCKIIFNPSTAVVGSTVGSGGTTIADTGSFSTAANVGWSLEANVYKYGAAGSNTQLGIHAAAQIGATVGTLLIPTLITATESGAILIAITGNAGTTATDILLNFAELFLMN
jgi:hypothetical protein